MVWPILQIFPYMDDDPIMITQQKLLFLDREKYSSMFSTADYNCYWEGLLFINGVSCGSESLKVFMSEIHSVGIRQACRHLKGIYFLLVEKKASGELYAFVDNSGLFQAFFSDKTISKSFLELIKYERCKEVDLDHEAVVEFLNLGNVFSNKTFFPNIKKMKWNEIYYFEPHNAKMSILKKDIPEIDIVPEEGLKSFEEIFEGLVTSLRNLKISVDLTGGIDSRLISVMLDYFGLSFETAISGTATNEDVILSKEVAEVLGHPWYCTYHSIDSLEDDINELFIVTEGLQDILSYHRLLQHQKSRIMRGIDIMISGDGGGFIKDFMWQQDFPFYNKNNANINRLVNLRIMPNEFNHQLLSEKISRISQSLRNRIIQELYQYNLSTNTKTYDNISFNYKMRELAGRMHTTNSKFLKCYVPFLDFDIVRIGFNLHRRVRFFNMFHRTLLTKFNPLIARMPTTEGNISASSEISAITKDLHKYIFDKINRLLIKKSHRFRNRNSTGSSGPDHPHLYHHARSLKVTKDCFDILKDVGIVKNATNLEQISDKYLGRFLSLAMLVKYISKNN